MTRKASRRPTQKRNLAAEAGRWSAQHRGKAILGWLVFVALAFAIGGAVKQRYLTQPEMGNGQSAQAARAYANAFPKEASEEVLIQGRGGVRIGSPEFTWAVQEVAGRLIGMPYVSNVRSPLFRENAGQLSHDGRSALVTFDVAGDESQVKTRVDGPLAAVAAAQRANPRVRIEELGEASSAKALDQSFSNDFRKAEYTSLPVTLIILLFAFGALVAAGVPLLLGLTAVLAAIGLLGPLSHVMPVPEGTIDSIVLLIGLAVAVDYSMFYLRRKLEERNAGEDGETALAKAAATSGRAVLISGLTVMTAMAGMFLAGNAVFTSFGLGTVLVVAVAVLGSVTVLPAVISKLGDKVEKGRGPIVARRRAGGQSRAWAFIIEHVLRHPVVSFALSAGVLLALALPALGMHTVDPGTVGLPRNLPIMHTYDRIEAAFPGGPSPAVVVVKAPDVTTPAVQKGLLDMSHAAATHRQHPLFTSVSPDRTVAAVSIGLPGSGTDSHSEAALATLRTRVIPATIGRVPGASAYVMGLTAGSKDFNDTMKAHLPLVFAFVLGMAFLLLLRTFRSVVIPITAIVLNLLSVGAAYGVLKLIFQDGYLRSLLGATNIGGVVDWLPLFLFVILFGLSMDYHVLILSRIREEHDRGRSTTDAVAHGLKSTAGVVTSAAIVMVAVFSIFATLSAVVFKQVGVGLAIAVLIDATIVRAVLLPSTMKLLGEWNWFMPGRGSRGEKPQRPATAARRPSPRAPAPRPG
jgi:uncharacterized membrane protein YdfJ with MMPL/SSD domain